MVRKALPLSELVQTLPKYRFLQEKNPIITGLSTDSRSIDPGNLFIAITGGQIIDRHLFVESAVKAGAAGVVIEKPIKVSSTNIAVILVPSTRDALGYLAEHYYDYPSKKLQTIGITGTNGKTTTATLIYQILTTAGYLSGLIGTIEYRIGRRVMPSIQTTPEAHILQQLLDDMVSAGCQTVVMETSSHGLSLGRLSNMTFDMGIVTNVTRDHLDLHGTFDDYLAAKSLLFNKHLEKNSIAIVNADDPFSEKILNRCNTKNILRFGISHHADVKLISGQTSWNASTLVLQTSRGKIKLTTRLTGSYHYWNILASVTAAIGLGIHTDAIIDAIRNFDIPGRFESLDCGQKFKIIIDYAHTPDALEKVLHSTRELASENIICVFGSDGDRDRGKRPEMGRIATSLADLAILTSTHPGTEDPNTIISDVLVGIKNKGNLRVIPDRLSAITYAIMNAKPEDIVIITGKGHEPYQVIGNKKVPFDDKQVTCKLIKELLVKS